MNFLNDLRYGARVLRKNPAFTLVAMITLALGIGANTAIFSVVYAVLLRPLPYQDSSRLVMLWETEPQLARAPVTGPDYIDWKAQSSAFEAIGAGTEGLGRANLTGGGQPEAVQSAPVSAGMFEMLGSRPFLGRVMRADEDTPGHDNVAVLSYALWERTFGADPRIVGQTITLDGKQREVVGVMPQDYQFPAIWGLRPDLWIPLAIRGDEHPRGDHWLYVIAKLKPGVPLERARSEMQTIAARLASAYPGSNTDVGANVEPLQDYLVAGLRPRLLILFGAVCFVLLIACANVANLLLTRTVSRTREMAVRAALGAGRGRLVRQLLTESVLLALLGGTAGLLLAYWLKDVISPETSVPLSGPVLFFTFAVSVVTGVLFGLMPAWSGFRTNLNDSLKAGGRTFAGAGGHRSRSVLVAVEIALALVLLVGAGLMIRTIGNLDRLDPGFHAPGLLTMRVDLPDLRYVSPDRREPFVSAALERIAGVPGVQSAAFTSQLPLGGGPNSNIHVEGRANDSGWKGTLVQPTSATPDYFRTMGIRLLRGRVIAQTDTASSRAVVVVNAALVRYFWPNEEALGKRLRFGSGDPWLEVVGVVANSRRWALADDPMPEVFFPYTQWPVSNMNLVVRSSLDAAGLLPAIRAEINRLDRDLPVYGATSMQQIVSQSTADTHYQALLLAALGIVALLLATTGIYGVMSQAVEQRTQEIGVRMALGAKPREVLWMVVGKAAVITMAGIGVGLAGSLALTRFLEKLLYGVKATDPLTFGAVAALLALVAVLASYIPARRAAHVDPMIALRYE